MRKAYDIAVIGGGIIGASTAKACARMLRRPQAVTLIDQFDTTSHHHGSSHGDGRIFRLAYNDPLYVEMARRSWTGWLDLQQETAEQLFNQRGGVNIGAKDSKAIIDLQNTLASCGVAYSTLDHQQLQERFPQFGIREDLCGVVQDSAAALHADRCRQAFTDSATRLGVDIRSNTKITNVRPSDKEVVIQTSTGDRITAQTVIIAAGAWTNQLLQQLDEKIPIRVSGEMAAYYRPKSSSNVKHTWDVMPTFIGHKVTDFNPYGLYGLPQIDIPGVKVATHYCGPTVDPDNRDTNHPTHAQMLKESNEFAQETFPHLEPTAFHTVHCMYSLTPDFDFVLDRLRNQPNICVAAGFSGHGFKFAPIIGQLMAQLALENKPELSLDKFSMSRFRS